MGSPSRNVQYHPPRLSEDRLNLPQPHSPSLPTHCSGKSGMRPPLVEELGRLVRRGLLQNDRQILSQLVGAVERTILSAQRLQAPHGRTLAAQHARLVLPRRRGSRIARCRPGHHHAIVRATETGAHPACDPHARGSRGKHIRPLHQAGGQAVPGARIPARPRHRMTAPASTASTRRTGTRNAARFRMERGDPQLKTGRSRPAGLPTRA